MTAREKTLYCESYNGKKAVADVRAGIKHPTWSLGDQLVKKEWLNDTRIRMIF